MALTFILSMVGSLSGFREGSDLTSLLFLKFPDVEIYCKRKANTEKSILESGKAESGGSRGSSSCVGGMRV